MQGRGIDKNSRHWNNLMRSSGIVLDLPMNEKAGATAFDRSRWGNDGAFNGAPAPVWREKGIFFESPAAFLDCGADLSLNITGPITLEIWVNPRTLKFSMFLGKYDLADNGYYFSILDGGGQLLWRLGGNAVISSLTSAGALLANEWAYVVVTWDGATMRQYLDGIQDTVTLARAALIGSAPARSLQVAANGGGGASTHDGLLASPRIHSRALSAAEVWRHYLATRRRYQ